MRDTFTADHRVKTPVVMVGAEQVSYTVTYTRLPRWRWVPRFLAHLPLLGRWTSAITLDEAPPIDKTVAIWYEADF